MRIALWYYGQALLHGFTVPQSATHALDEWRREADQVRQFVDDGCVRNPMARVAVSELYRGFRDWCVRTGVRTVVGQPSFSKRLVDGLGFERERSDGSKIAGLQLRQL